MRLIDADKLFQETEKNMHNNPHSDPTHAAMHKHEHCHFLCEINKQPEIDPIYAAGGCYCKECVKANLLDDKNGYYCTKGITMPLNGFCSEGRKDEMKDG